MPRRKGEFQRSVRRRGWPSPAPICAASIGRPCAKQQGSCRPSFDTNKWVQGLAQRESVGFANSVMSPFDTAHPQRLYQYSVGSGNVAVVQHRVPTTRCKTTACRGMLYLIMERLRGPHTGRPAVSAASRAARCGRVGRRIDRPPFADSATQTSDGKGGGEFVTSGSLSDAIDSKWPQNDRSGSRKVVCTGGEPLLQLVACF